MDKSDKRRDKMYKGGNKENMNQGEKTKMGTDKRENK